MHNNIFMDYFALHGVFDTLLALNRTDPGLPLPCAAKLSALTAILVHHKKHESRNVFLERLGKNLESRDIERMNDLITVMFSIGRSLEEINTKHIAQAEAASAAAATTSQEEHSFSPLAVLTTAVATAVSFVYSNAPDDSEMQRKRAKSIAYYSRACAGMSLYILYTMLAHNNKFVLRTAKLRREIVISPGHSGTGNGASARKVMVVPTTLPSAVCAFISATSSILNRAMRPRSLMMARLSLIVCRIMTEDTAANIVLHDASLKCSIDVCVPVSWRFICVSMLHRIHFIIRLHGCVTMTDSMTDSMTDLMND
jgi:hypothetical protein